MRQLAAEAAKANNEKKIKFMGIWKIWKHKMVYSD